MSRKQTMLRVLLSDEDRRLAADDRRLFGASYIRIDADGVATRIDPKDIKIEKTVSWGTSKCVAEHMGGRRCVGKCLDPKDCSETPL